MTDTQAPLNAAVPTPPHHVDALAGSMEQVAKTVFALSQTVEALSATQREHRCPAPPAEPVEDGISEASVGQVTEAYGTYIALFVGAGLLSGSIVHFPLDPARYTIIGAVGGALFAAASAIGDVRKNGFSMATIRIAVASLLLSLGIGMMSGGIQHFEDFPARAAMLIPAGLLLSVPSFVARQGYGLRFSLLWLAAGTVAIAAIAAVGLQVVAHDLVANATAGGHAHGGEAATATTVPGVVPATAVVGDRH